ncbi:MAG: Mrp/NBP35 family ATP-binding protein, partial [bacterium]
MATEADVLKALESVRDPDLHRDIVALGFVQRVTIKDGVVSFAIELTTPACPVRDQLRDEAARAVGALPGVTRVDVTMGSRVRSGDTAARPGVLPGVRNVVPIASGKGGVGKSTVSANLAVALAMSGAKVGLLDLDVYGPSIPAILGLREEPKVVEDRLIPPVVHGVKVMSMGFFMKEDEATIWRGPMLHKVVEQFLMQVEWGELDYLLMDFPPGTGDVQLSVCQLVPLTGAVIVSTPQDIALNVARKAIVMFDRLQTPILGIVENMSYFVCPHCGEREDIFGTGGAKAAAAKADLPFLG